METSELLLRAAEYIEAICDDLRDSGIETPKHQTDRAFASELRAAADAERWRPASEPPDDETTVMVACDDGEIATGYRVGPEWFHAGRPGDFARGITVTHWRERPEGPAA